jgi:LuxR family maltose regulon positive regulatory protein
MLHERTEGWAAGLRLAALSLAGHPDPERLAAEFSGSERTVAEYLVAEVLERQPAPVRRLLLRTSLLERMNAPLANHVTGGQDAERVLQDLEQANAFVVALDPGRTWFRYRRLFAELLALELRRTAAEELPGLHRAAAEWFAEHDYPVEAIRHAQAAGNWRLAAQLLWDNALALRLDGRGVVVLELLAAFPGHVVQQDPELIALMAVEKLNHGSLDEAQRFVNWAAQESDSVLAERRQRFEVRLGVLRLRIARGRGNLPAVFGEAQRLLAPVEAPDDDQIGLGELQRAMALIELGIAELWSAQLAGLDQHLEHGIALARRIGRPYLEVLGLGHWAFAAGISSYALAVERSTQAVELARRHGWAEEPIVAVAYLALGTVNVWRAQLEEAQTWLDRAERALRAEIDPATRMLLQQNRGLLELARGRENHALEEFMAAERHAELLVDGHPLATKMRAHRLQALLRLGQIERVEEAVGQMEAAVLETGEMRTALAALRLAQGDAPAATLAIAPTLDGSAAVSTHHVWQVQAFLLEALARDALGDAAAAQTALERALDLAEPHGVLLPFVLHPARALLERHSGHTKHAALLSEIVGLLAGRTPALASGESQRLSEPLSESETRVLRYLPTNLSLREIGNELYVSVHTVKTHAKHIYAKLGVHGRAEAVDRARRLGLLAPSSHRR